MRRTGWLAFGFIMAKVPLATFLTHVSPNPATKRMECNSPHASCVKQLVRSGLRRASMLAQLPRKRDDLYPIAIPR